MSSGKVKIYISQVEDRLGSFLFHFADNTAVELPDKISRFWMQSNICMNAFIDAAAYGIRI